jgi:Fe-S cluster biogenesis protein NfuA
MKCSDSGNNCATKVIEWESVNDDGVVKVRLTGACAGCPMSQFTLVNFVEATLKDKVPAVKEVVAVDDAKTRFEEINHRTPDCCGI